jgi:hypothetical protein
MHELGKQLPAEDLFVSFHVFKLTLLPITVQGTTLAWGMLESQAISMETLLPSWVT